MPRKNTRQVEYGDFQTPASLAAQVVSLLQHLGFRPRAVVEPTFGLGTFVLAAMQGFDSARTFVGVEINDQHFAQANASLTSESRKPQLDLRCADFFDMDWSSVIQNLPKPVLLLGNPPWVTSSGLGAVQGTNLPRKSNFQGHTGLDAKTGKANFDIAEWMVIHLLKSASDTPSVLAMLVKSSVARKVLVHAWRTKLPISAAAIYEIDAARHFGVSASACLLVCRLGNRQAVQECGVFSLDSPEHRIATIGMRNGKLVAETAAYDRCSDLAAAKPDRVFRWRSGIKHDCSSVMELQHIGPNAFRNGQGNIVQLEEVFLYPLLKGSDVACGRIATTDRWMIVPQKTPGDDTSAIQWHAPRTWDYLNQNREALDRRRSSIYRQRPSFSVFGVGAYTFAPWKVAICGLYKRLEFVVIGPRLARPVVFDDTVYYLSFNSESDARRAATLLNSEAARAFFSSIIFWDAKRPITAEVLNRLDLRRLLGEPEDLGLYSASVLNNN